MASTISRNVLWTAVMCIFILLELYIHDRSRWEWMFVKCTLKMPQMFTFEENRWMADICVNESVFAWPASRGNSTFPFGRRKTIRFSFWYTDGIPRPTKCLSLFNSSERVSRSDQIHSPRENVTLHCDSTFWMKWLQFPDLVLCKTLEFVSVPVTLVIVHDNNFNFQSYWIHRMMDGLYQINSSNLLWIYSFIFLINLFLSLSLL